MKISVVVPAHNEEKNIPAIIEHLLCQDYPDFEVIVVDNASTDRTFEYAKKYPVHIVQESRLGLPRAREAGRLMATGEIIANVDADFLPEPHWLSSCMRHFNDGKVVAVSGPYDYYDAPQWFRLFNIWFQEYILGQWWMNVLMGRGKNGGWIAGGHSLIRASALSRLNGYDTSIEFWGEDIRTAELLARQGTVIFDPHILMKTSARRFFGPGKNIWKSSFTYILLVLGLGTK